MNTSNLTTRKVIYDKAVKKWGIRGQLVAAIEEFSELINELAKGLNGKDKRGKEGLVDELSDCRIMIEQIEHDYGLEDEVKIRIDEKLLKLDQILDEKKKITNSHKN